VPKYSALDQPIQFKTSLSDLLALTWVKGGIAADFEVPGQQERALRVHVERTLILRVLDEMPLSTEQDGKSEGLVSEHFAYLVEDSAFFKAQSEAFRICCPKARHYRFITGSTCLDVISDVEPSLEVVSRKLQPA
jgi:hypothetical protein